MIPALLRFFQPTRYKLAFVLEWLLYLLFEAALTRFEIFQHWLAAILPFFFLYLCGCMLISLRPKQPGMALPALLGLAVGFGIVDQAAKWAVSQVLAPGAEQVLIPSGLSLMRSHNLELSWLLNRFEVTGVGRGWIIALTAVCLILVVMYFRQYSATQRKSYWGEMAFLFMAAGMVSALCDQALVGWTVDFIGLPGLFAADLKDIYLYLAVGSLLAEIIESSGARLDDRLTETSTIIRRFFKLKD